MVICHSFGIWEYQHSPGGLFTGGNATTPPTATDATQLYNNTCFGRFSGSVAPFICHVSVSDDLTCCRQWHFYNANPSHLNIMYDEIDDPSAGISPNFGMLEATGLPGGGSELLFDVTTWGFGFVGGGADGGQFIGRGPHGQMNMATTTEGYSDGSFTQLQRLNTAKNKVTGTYRNLPGLGLQAPWSSDDGGWHGRVFDVWCAPALGTGSTAPLDGSKQVVILKDFMFPWNGTAFRMT
jgi:hypothetical protein